MQEFDRPGDLHVVFHLKPSSNNGWRRVGQVEEHLLYELTINLSESLLGLTVQLDGHPGYQDGLFLQIPGALNGDVFCYDDLGMPLVGQSGKFGKGYVRVRVVPENDEREMLFVKARAENGPGLKELFNNRVRKVTIGPETDINNLGYLCAINY
jgi:DnaJ-class molecular chaperone